MFEKLKNARRHLSATDNNSRAQGKPSHEYSASFDSKAAIEAAECLIENTVWSTLACAQRQEQVKKWRCIVQEAHKSLKSIYNNYNVEKIRTSLKSIVCDLSLLGREMDAIRRAFEFVCLVP